MKREHYILGLPDGYTELEYIQSTGTQWIDTGITLNGDSMVSIDFQYTQSVGRLFGFDDTPRFRFGTGGAGTWYTGYGSGSYRLVGTSDLVRHEFKLAKNVFYVDDTAVVTFTKESFECNGTAYIFMVHGITTYMADYSSGKLYRLSISNDDGTVADFIPALRNLDSKPGLYDTVRQQFYVNQGTGEFLYE